MYIGNIEIAEVDKLKAKSKIQKEKTCKHYKNSLK